MGPVPTQAVLQADQQAVGGIAEDAAIVERLGGGACDEVTPVDPDQDGEGPQQGGAEVDPPRGEDVEVQTVLTDLRGQRSDVSEIRVTSLQRGPEVSVTSLQTASRGLSYRQHR